MPDLRKDPLSGRWVVFSTERRRRPTDFRVGLTPQAAESPFTHGREHLTPPEVFAIRPNGGPHNSPDWQVRVVPNRYPALRVEGELTRRAEGIYDAMSGIGAHEVVAETHIPEIPFHELPPEQIVRVLEALRSRWEDLRRDGRLKHLVAFKNHGALAGATLRHPHSQIVATPFVPPAAAAKLDAAREHFARTDRSLFQDILDTERRTAERLICQNHDFAAFCPYASRAPFEIAIYPSFQSHDFGRCQTHDFWQLSEILREALARLHASLDDPPFNMLLISAPLQEDPLRWPTLHQDFRWHIEILPRLSVFAGFEMATGCFINTVTPEEAARHLRQVQLPR